MVSWWKVTVQGVVHAGGGDNAQLTRQMTCAFTAAFGVVFVNTQRGSDDVSVQKKGHDFSELKQGRGH